MQTMAVEAAVKGHLEALVGIPSVSGDKKFTHEALQYVADRLRRFGMSVAWHEDGGYESFVATARPGEKRPHIMLYAHIDVVSGGEDLWRLREQDGKYRGRGVCDMKFALAAYLVFVETVAAELDTYDFGIMVVSDEEHGGMHGAGYLSSIEYCPDICILPDGGEGWNIETYAKGYAWVDIETRGKAAHGSRPWEGVNAMESMLMLLQEIRAQFPGEPQPEADTMNIGYVRSGGTHNHIPDKATAGLDIRFTSSEAELSIMRMLQGCCARHGATMTIRSRGAAFATDVHAPAVRSFIKTVQAVTGRQPKPHQAHGATDAGFFEADTLCLVCMPDAGGRHGDDEWIDIEGVSLFVQVLHAYVTESAGMVMPAAT